MEKRMCHGCHRVRIKRIAITKCDPFFNYRDANVANSTKFAIPNCVHNISFLLSGCNILCLVSQLFTNYTQQKHHNSARLNI